MNDHQVFWLISLIIFPGFVKIIHPFSRVMELEDVETETMLISELGYDPYNIVLYVTKDYFS
jgi:hypothetical protein